MKPTHTNRSLVRLMLPATLAGLLVGFAFVFFFTSALHDPKPNGVKLGVVAPPPAVTQIRAQLEQAAPGGFALTAYPDAGAATKAVADQDVSGAFIASPTSPTLITAGAQGASTDQIMRAAFGAAAAAQHQHLTVKDVAPVPTHDARGLSAFFIVAGTTMGSIVFSAALFFLGGHGGFAPIRVRLSMVAGFAVAAGLVVAVDSDLIADGLGGAFWATAGIVALLAAAVSLTTAAIARWLGAPGLVLGLLLFMLFSLPASGGPVGPDLVPDAYHSIAAILPSHAAVIALRGAAYFDGGVLTPVLILLAWIAAALAAHVLAHVASHRAPHPPVIGAIPTLGRA